MASKIYDKSIFKPYFESNDSEVEAWTENVLAKLIAPGQVAEYIKRETEEGEVTDFATIYRPFVKFFAYLVKLSREFRDFKDDDYLIDRYLNQKGQFTCSEETLEQLQYLVTNLLRVRAQRGTTKMIEQSVDSSIPSGELLRLLCWNQETYFKLGLGASKNNGWNVNNSSPLSRSLTGRYDLNSAWEDTENIMDLSKYPLTNSSYISIKPYRGKNCLSIQDVPFGQSAGISAVTDSKGMVVDPRLNFEIMFYVAQDITLENLTFGCRAFDANGSEVSLLDVVTGAQRSMFFETRRLNKAGTFYMIRGIIYNKDIDQLTVEEARLNIGFGGNLKFTEDVVRIVPYILMDNNFTDDSDSESDTFADSDSILIDTGSSGIGDSGYWSDPSYDGEPSIFIWNVKINPCNTYYNRCYLDNKNFIDLFSVNKSGKYSDSQIQDILRKYFIPYNTAFQNTSIGEISEVNPDVSALLLEDSNYILLETEDRILLENR